MVGESIFREDILIIVGGGGLELEGEDEVGLREERVGEKLVILIL
jgi:hypothetical protein